MKTVIPGMMVTVLAMAIVSTNVRAEDASKAKNAPAATKVAYDTALAQAQVFEKAEKWKEASASAEKALASGWKETAAAIALLERVDKHLVFQPGEKRTVSLGGGVDLELIWVPATTSEAWKKLSGGKDTFTMGSPETETNRADSEGPQHEVRFAKGFWMGKYEVMQGQYERVMGEKENRSHWQGDDFPVELVNWHKAREFCDKAGQSAGVRVRLPSEAEWEYACRAGTTGAFAGNLGDMGWYFTNGGGETHPVGQKKANPWGLYDMHGNVMEWCEDVGHDNYEGAPTNGSAWTSGANKDVRVMRGGSWNWAGGRCRSATRYWDLAHGVNMSLGFRVCVGTAMTSVPIKKTGE